MHKQKFSLPGMVKAVRTTFSHEPLLLDPKSDIVFKAIFTHGTTGRIALLGLLNAVLSFPSGKKIARIEYLNTHAYGMFHGQKKPVMDIIVKTEDERLINIEIQVEKKDNYFYRTQHYLACMLHDQSIAGESYGKLKSCISINILDYDIGTGLSDFHTCYRMHETTKLSPMPYPLTEIHFIELRKLKEYIQGEMPESILEKWAFYFKDLPENRYPEIMKQILKDEKEIYMAEEARIKVSLMEKFLYSYRSYQRARWDEKSSLDYAREQGLAKGKAEGEIKGKAEGKEEGQKQSQVEIARNMKKLGASADFILQATALTAEEIEKL